MRNSFLLSGHVSRHSVGTEQLPFEELRSLARLLPIDFSSCLTAPALFLLR